MQIRLSEVLPLGAIALGIIVSQAMGFHGPTTAFFAIFAVLASGYVLGPRLLPDVSTRLGMVWGSLGATALLMLLRGVWFYLAPALDGWAEALTTVEFLTLSIIGAITIEDRRVDEEIQDRETSLLSSLMECGLLLCSLIGFGLIARAAYLAQTSESIRTPWPFMPWWTLPLMGLLWMLALSSAWRFRRPRITFVQLMCAIGSIVVIAPLLYRIGYGFDGFLHVAGEIILAKTGTLQPKPPYYMGQYVFVTWLSDLFELDIAVIDRWLVPIASLTLIPLAGYLAAKRSVTTLLAALILIPLGAFVTTTPHGFATVLAAVSLILVIRPNTRTIPSFILPTLFACWSTLTHPLVGLPILFAIAACFFWQKKTRWPLGLPLAIATGIAVPLLFGLANGTGSSAGVAFDLSKIFNSTTWSGFFSSVIPWVPNRYALWPEASVWVEKLLPWITIIFAVIGMIHHRKRMDEASDSSPMPWMIAAGSTFIAAFILQTAGDFGFLIDYERGNYAARLFMVAWLLLLPVAIPELARKLSDAAHAPFINKLALLLIIGLLGAGASYAALPRHDAVTPSRGWSVGSADIEAVKLIDQDAGGKPYTVLANQSVSAAAVKTYGFKRYNGDVFFYPIPTGGALYDVFLRASYEDPSRETMREAGRLGGSDLVYFVVNDYWWKAPQLSESAASSTDREFVIQNGKVNVFKYELK